MTIGIIGLGKMGSRMAKKLIREGQDVRVWNRSPDPVSEILKVAPGIKAFPTLQELLASLPKPRVAWLMLPAGEPTEAVLSQVLTYLEKGDIVIDGGNAHFKDTEKRFEELKKKGIRFLGIGLSGGVIAERDGYPAMVGGDKSGYEHIIPILDSLGTPHGGHAYFGEGGAGHFVKMVHNGIEYGLMQSLGEGFEVLSKSPYNLDLLSVAKLWQKGTLVSGFMLDRAVDSLTPDPTLKDIIGTIAESGEAKWTVETAKEQGTDVEIIAASLAYRKQSQTDPNIQQSFTAKLVASLRNAFGGHDVRKK